MNPSLELSNALPNEQAQVEEAEQLLNRLQYLDLDAYQAEYLNAWQAFYNNHRYYLFPDDRAAQEYEPLRSEDVSTLSYRRTAEAVKQTRQDVLQGNKERLDSMLFTATSPITHRHKLAHECYNTAERLKRYEADVFTDLTAATYTPCLPPIYSSWPERRVDEPATVGAALGLLDFLAYVCAEYKTSQSSTPAHPTVTRTPDADTDSPSIQKTRFINGFSAEDADRVAFEIDLIDAQGNYTGLLGIAPGRLCGFYKMLKDEKKISGNLEILRDYFAMRYLKHPVRSKPAPQTHIAKDTATETKTVLYRLFPKEIPG